MQTPDNKKTSQQKIDCAKVLRIASVIIVFIIIVLKFFTSVDAVPFHGDEVGWSTSGYYYYQLMFIEHDVSPAKWNRRDLREWGLLSLPVGKYLIGLAMHIALPRGDYFWMYDFSKNEEQNRERGNIPPLEILRPGRIMSAIASTLSCVAIFWICTLVWNWVVGAMSALLLSFNPLFHLFAQRAMTDSYLILFLVIAVLCCLYMGRIHTSASRLYLFSALLGIVCGMGGSVKLNGFMILVFGTFTLFLFAIAVKPRSWKNFKKYFIAEGFIIACAGGIFIALNPLFYTSSPSEIADRFSQLVDAWTRLLQFQQRMFSTQAIVGFPSMALTQLAREYLSPVITIAALLGAVSTLKQIIDKGLNANISLVILFSTSAIIIITVFRWIPLDWDRYYLPIVVMSMPFAAYGLFTAAEFVFHRISQNVRSSQLLSLEVKKKKKKRNKQ